MITQVIRVNWLGTLSVCTKFHCNPSKRCRDISVWTKQHKSQASSMAKNTICWWGPYDVIKCTRAANKWATRGDCFVDGCFQEWTLKPKERRFANRSFVIWKDAVHSLTQQQRIFSTSQKQNVASHFITCHPLAPVHWGERVLGTWPWPHGNDLSS